jgi:hypothetical protein
LRRGTTKSTEIGGQNNAADAEDVTKLDDLRPERRRKVITMGPTAHPGGALRLHAEEVGEQGGVPL